MITLKRDEFINAIVSALETNYDVRLPRVADCSKLCVQLSEQLPEDNRKDLLQIAYNKTLAANLHKILLAIAEYLAVPPALLPALIGRSNGYFDSGLLVNSIKVGSIKHSVTTLLYAFYDVLQMKPSTIAMHPTAAQDICKFVIYASTRGDWFDERLQALNQFYFLAALMDAPVLKTQEGLNWIYEFKFTHATIVRNFFVANYEFSTLPGRTVVQFKDPDKKVTMAEIKSKLANPKKSAKPPKVVAEESFYELTVDEAKQSVSVYHKTSGQTVAIDTRSVVVINNAELAREEEDDA